MTDDVLRQSALKVLEYRNDQRCCQVCTGLHQCTLSFPGRYTKLEVIQQPGQPLKLEDRRVRCQFQRLHDKQQEIRNKITSYHLDLDTLAETYQIEEIVKRERSRIPAVRKIIEYIQQAQQSKVLSPKGLYVQGHFGTGKTYLMGYLLMEMAKLGHAGAIIYMPDFVEDMKNQMKDVAKIQQTIQVLKEVDLLIFDDVGAENLNPWFGDHILGAILNARMDKKPTFYTSNYALENMKEHFAFTHRDGDDRLKAERLMNRIVPYVEVVVTAGPNQRYDNGDQDQQSVGV